MRDNQNSVDASTVNSTTDLERKNGKSNPQYNNPFKSILSYSNHLINQFFPIIDKNNSNYVVQQQVNDRHTGQFDDENGDYNQVPPMSLYTAALINTEQVKPRYDH